MEAIMTEQEDFNQRSRRCLLATFFGSSLTGIRDDRAFAIDETILLLRTIDGLVEPDPVVIERIWRNLLNDVGSSKKAIAMLVFCGLYGDPLSFTPLDFACHDG